MSRNKSIKGLAAALAAAFFLTLCGACGEDLTADNVDIPADDLDLQVVLPPAYPTYMEGSTLVIKSYNTTPAVHSYPDYSGVEQIGDIGIGKAAGYDPGDSFLIPVNMNTGDGRLESYKICITISQPSYLNLKSISGSEPELYKKYSTQYNRAAGFEKPPTIDTYSPLCFSAVTTDFPVKGKVNLAGLTFTIVKTLPPEGVRLTFDAVELTNQAGDTICDGLPSGCKEYNGIVNNNFTLRQ